MITILLHSCSADQNNVADSKCFIVPVVTIDPAMKFVGEDRTIAVPEDEIPPVEQLTFAMENLLGQGAHTWDAFSQYDATQSLLAGSYRLVLTTPRHFSQDGYAGFEAHAEVNVEPGSTANVPMTLRPTVGCVIMSADALSDGDCRLDALSVHDAAGNLSTLSADQGKIEGRRYVAPGRSTLVAHLVNSAGREVRLYSDAELTILAAEAAEAKASLAGGKISFSLGNSSAEIPVDGSIFDLNAPVLSAVGFDPSVPFKAEEGIALKEPFKVVAKSDRPMEHLLLNINSPLYGTAPVMEYDLVQNTGEIAELLAAGVSISADESRREITIDFTKALENVATSTSASTLISMMAVDDRGLCSETMDFEVVTSTVDFQLVSSTPAVIGVDRATITLSTSSPLVETSDFRIFTYDKNSQSQIPCPISDMKLSDNNTRVTISFDIPAGVRPVDVDVQYMDVKRLSTTISRAAPDFDMSFDSYATTTIVRIANPDPAIVRAIVSLATFTANGQRVTVWERFPDKGTVILSGLKPDTKYNIAVRFGDIEASSTATTSTEVAAQLPDGDFEDAKQIIDYKHLACGGRYSSTDMNIVNRQNFVDVAVYWPKKYWASVNAKTFDKNSENPNTWYMQPSSEIVYESVSGTKSIKITSVGWDRHGQAIPDYIQLPGQQLPYNNNIPSVTHRSAGRLFLGSYSYNRNTGEETYDEGIGFSSRPSSLNGFFKYQPDLDHPADMGHGSVRLYGRDSSGSEILIAQGEANFRFAPDFIAFNIPLSYSVYDVKATRLCVMFTSSIHAGNQSEEDNNIPVTPLPEKGTMQGSALWIDNISFSY